MVVILGFGTYSVDFSRLTLLSNINGGENRVDQPIEVTSPNNRGDSMGGGDMHKRKVGIFPIVYHKSMKSSLLFTTVIGY